MLPWEWWKLSLVWLVQVPKRTPPVRKGLLPNSLQTSVLGLALSMAALSLTLAIFSGFEDVLASSISRSLGYVSHFTHWRSQEELDALKALAPQDQIRSAYSFWTTQGLLVGPQGGRGVMIEGRHGTLSAPLPPQSPVLVDLGKPLAEHLGVHSGDTLRILLPGVLDHSIEARVRQLTEYGMYDLDSRTAIVVDESLRPILETSSSYAERPGDGHGLRYSLTFPPSHLSELHAWLNNYKKALELKGLADPQDSFRTWEDLQHNLLGSIGLDKKVLVILMSLLVLVATLNIAATLIVLFLERDREIALLRAIGLSPRHLRQWICIQGFVVGVLASGLGIFLGRSLGWVVQKLPWAQLPQDIYHIKALPLRFDGYEQGFTFLFGVLCASSLAWILGHPLARTRLLDVLGQRR